VAEQGGHLRWRSRVLHGGRQTLAGCHSPAAPAIGANLCKRTLPACSATIARVSAPLPAQRLTPRKLKSHHWVKILGLEPRHALQAAKRLSALLRVLRRREAAQQVQQTIEMPSGSGKHGRRDLLLSPSAYRRFSCSQFILQTSGLWQRLGFTSGAPCTAEGTVRLRPCMERRRRETLNLSATLGSSWSSTRWVLHAASQR
jgi:hypothetical protein